jgi:hypothetical protein
LERILQMFGANENKSQMQNLLHFWLNCNKH